LSYRARQIAGTSTPPHSRKRGVLPLLHVLRVERAGEAESRHPPSVPILDDLQRDAVVIFSAVHDTGGAFGCIVVGVKVTNVEVTQNRPAMPVAACVEASGWEGCLTITNARRDRRFG
jgi:hypothetical protein